MNVAAAASAVETFLVASQSEFEKEVLQLWCNFKAFAVLSYLIHIIYLGLNVKHGYSTP
jgi:hypothetical protein